MVRVALLSNPNSTGNRALLPSIRSFCAANDDIFHYEVEHVDQIGEALRTIARIRPRVLVINGGDGTVQATLTELHQGGHFGDTPPPVAVLPNGKTNLIALDLGSVGNPIAALQRVMTLAHEDLAPHIVVRELIALSDGEAGSRPVLGMFLGGAGLADSMLYCRNTMYPTGLPNGLCHVLTGAAVLFSGLFGIRAAFLPPRPRPVNVSVIRQGQRQGRYTVLIVTTLQRLIMGTRPGHDEEETGALRLMLVDHRPWTLVRAAAAAIFGKLGSERRAGIHVGRGDEIRIEGERPSVILDGELFEAGAGRPIVLKHTAPVPFLHLQLAA